MRREERLGEGRSGDVDFPRAVCKVAWIME
jgi:hypothetical protein